MAESSLPHESPESSDLDYQSDSKSEKIEARGEISKLENSFNFNLDAQYTDTAMPPQKTTTKRGLAMCSLLRECPVSDNIVYESDSQSEKIEASGEIEKPSELELSCRGILARGRHRTALRFRKTVSPISIIPSEVLLRIFQYYVADFPYLPRGCLRDIIFAPWLLGQVCQEWRVVSTSTSYLWRKVKIHWSPHEHPAEWRMTEKRRDAISYLLLAQMELSKTYPLEVSLDLDALLPGVYPNSLDIILAHRHRWRILRLSYIPNKEDEDEELNRRAPMLDLSMETTSQKIFLPSTEGTPLVFALLEDLYIIMDAHTVLDIFSNCSFPSLTKLSYGKGLARFPRMAPWSNLKDVFLHVVLAEEFLPTLPLLTSVIRLTVGYLLHSDDHMLEAKIAVLPCLEELKMWKGWAPAMAVMTAPCMRYLSIGDGELEGGIDATEDIEAVVIMAHRSSAPISKLRMCLPAPLDPTIHSLLSSLPNLVELVVELFDSYQDGEVSFLTHLTDALHAKNPEGGFSVCPHLSKIILYNESRGWIEDDISMVFLDMLEARHNNPGSNFRSATLLDLWELCEGENGNLGRRLEALRSMGLDIRTAI